MADNLEVSVEKIGLEIPNIASLSTYDKVTKSCELLLEREKKFDSNNTINGTALFQMAQETFGNEIGDIAKNTFLQYLSNSSKDTESRINCLGKKQGYYLVNLDEVIKHSDKEAELADLEEYDGENKQGRKQKEILLYPVLESWLIAQGYQAADVSKGRTLGKWGNPDVAGLSAIDSFNGLSVEVITIEAKISLENWEQWVFEAVSHRRFANRSYFAFAHPAETITKIPQDMRYYAELYNIGVLVLSVENDKFGNLVKGNLEEPLGSEDVDIIEMYSAPYNFVQPKYQLKFCYALGITNIKELYQWGQAPK